MTIHKEINHLIVNWDVTFFSNALVFIDFGYDWPKNKVPQKKKKKKKNIYIYIIYV